MDGFKSSLLYKTCWLLLSSFLRHIDEEQELESARNLYNRCICVYTEHTEPGTAGLVLGEVSFEEFEVEGGDW